MTSPAADELRYPEPPASRMPGPVWFLLAPLALTVSAAAALFLGVYWYEYLEWNYWASAFASLGVAIVVATALFTLVAWGRTPKGGWPAEFPMPLIARVFVRVLVLIGGGGLLLLGMPGLIWEGAPDALVGIIGTQALILLSILGPTATSRMCAPVGGLEAMYDRWRPRGTQSSDPLRPEEIESVTGRAVVEVVRLDTANPGYRATQPRTVGTRARYVLDDGSNVEMTLKYLSGPLASSSPAARAEAGKMGTTPDARVAYLRKHYRLDAVPDIGPQAYACVPLQGGDEWLWARVDDEAVLELRTSPRFDRWARSKLGQIAVAGVERRHLDWERELDEEP